MAQAPDARRLAEKPLEETLDAAIRNGANGEISIDALLDAFGHRGFGPLLIILGIIAVSPIGAIPGVPAVIGIAVALIAGQLLLGHDHPWLPGSIRRMAVKTRRVQQVRRDARDWLKRIDALVSERLPHATDEVARRGAAFLSIFLAGLMVPLEAIPFANAIPGTGIILFGLALTAKDGLIMIIACGLTLIAGGIIAVGV